MNEYDVVVIGGATTGSYFARKCAEKGLDVLIIEKENRENLSSDYDIFHMEAADLLRFGLPKPDGDSYGFEFEDGTGYSAYGHYPKHSKTRTVGMHKRAYIQKLNDWAMNAGAEIIYGAAFTGFVFGENGRICGVTYSKDEKSESVSCRLAADCSGIPSVGRTVLPDLYGVENFKMTNRDVFFVILRYIEFKERQPGFLHSDSWIFYKTWLAPSGNEADAILGVGASSGYDRAEKMLERFSKNVKLPEYTVLKTEKGLTPYRRPPYSFVADGFIVLGDAACLTRPFSGEGCASSMVQAEIAADTIAKVMSDGAYPTRETLWSINKRYIEAQGKSYAALLATLTGAVRHGAKANEFFFRHDIVLSKKKTSAMPESIRTAFFFAVGILSGQVKVSEVKSIFKGVKNAAKVSELYDRYPDTQDGFEAWTKEADALWNEIGSMSDWNPLE